MRSHHSPPLQRSLGALVPALLLAACGGSSGGDSAANGMSGQMSVLNDGGGGPILEAEPNDTVDQAQVLADVHPGDALTILGSSTDDGSDDYDGFEVHCPERAVFDISLTAPSADLDLLVYDAVSLQPVALFQADGDESGSFVAQGTFFLVLYSFSGASDYQLDVSLSALPAVLPEIEPNDVSGQAMYLGELATGQQIVVGGSIAGADVSDRFLIAVPGALTLDLSLLHEAGQDLDLFVRNATSDVQNPTDITSFETSNNPESGSVGISAMTLVEVEVFPFNNSESTWQLTLSSGVGPLGPGGIATLSPLPRGVDPALAGRLRGPASRAPFTVPALELVPGDVLVRAKDEARDALVDDRLAPRGGTTTARIPDGGARKVHFELPVGLDDVEAARYTIALRAALGSCDELRYAEPNLILRATALDTEPDDSFYNLQWHYGLINLPAAWDITKGDNNVIVAVIDTGSTPAQDLVNREIQGIDMISDPARARDGDGIDNDPFDEGDSNGFQSSSFHGSHVAGTIAASTDNGYGVAGVTWLTRVFHVRVLGLNGGDLFDISNGILYAARLSNVSGSLPAQQADIMNMSLGGPGFSQTMQDAVTAARSAGTLVVAAAGNENSDDQFIPASLNGVISVSAVDYSAKKAPYSNFHPTVDICAPGGDLSKDKNGDGHPDGVLSTKPDDTQNPTNYEVFAFYQGTSMAAPHVAGVAALVLAVDPGLTVPELENLLLSTSTDLGAPGRDDIYGEGLVDAFAAVQAAAGGGGGPVLGLSTQSLLFDQRDECATVQVSNLGGGLLEVTNVSVSTDSGGAWLSAEAIPIQGGSKSDTSGIEVCVDGTPLADGIYSGQVVVTSTGGTRTIEVTLALGVGGNGETYTVYVVVVDVDEFVTVDQDVVQTSGNLKYSFEDLPKGNYIIAAGTDEDDDGFICDEGEPLCGVYPSLEQPEVIQLGKKTTVKNLDFPLLPSFGGATTGGPKGFRLLSHEGGDR